MLSGISRKRSIRSNPYWFTEFCNSQCISHFAAPFIVVRAETSVAESCKTNLGMTDRAAKEKIRENTKSGSRDKGRRQEEEWKTVPPSLPPSSFPPGASLLRREQLHPQQEPHTVRCTVIQEWISRANDPSAGSPTETLLRLLLPLSDKVH